MSTLFDPIKAQREIVAAAQDVHRTVLSFARNAERDLGEAEAIRNAAIKVEAFARADLEAKQAKLNQLMLAANVSAT